MPGPRQPSCHLQVRPLQWALGGPQRSWFSFMSALPPRAEVPSVFCGRWKMNGTEMKLEPDSRHQLVGGNLVIINPTKAQDAGVYQCLASNPVGTVVSREAVLRFGCETQGGAKTLEGGQERAGTMHARTRDTLRLGFPTLTNELMASLWSMR